MLPGGAQLRRSNMLSLVNVMNPSCPASSSKTVEWAVRHKKSRCACGGLGIRLSLGYVRRVR